MASATCDRISLSVLVGAASPLEQVSIFFDSADSFRSYLTDSPVHDPATETAMTVSAWKSNFIFLVRKRLEDRAKGRRYKLSIGRDDQRGNNKIFIIYL